MMAEGDGVYRGLGLLSIGYFTVTLGGPIVHLTNGGGVRAVGSAALRVVLPQLAGRVAGRLSVCDGLCPLGVMGAALVGGALVDTIFLGEKTLKKSTSVGAAPTRRGAVALLSGEF